MHEEANLVDQACAAERPNEPSTAVREQVAVGLLLELGDRGGVRNQVCIPYRIRWRPT